MNPDVASMPPAQSPVPTMKADMRPTADTAALVRDPRPEVPLPIPASNGQSAAVTQSKVSSSTKLDAVEAVEDVGRVLKPYGVAMLPESLKQPEKPKEDDVAQDKPEPKQEKVEAKEVEKPTKPEPKAEVKPPEPAPEAKKEEAPVTQKSSEAAPTET